MPSLVRNMAGLKYHPKKKTIEDNEQIEEENMSENDDSYINPDVEDFDFLGNYDDMPDAQDERMLPENKAESALSCAFIGVGGGGGQTSKGIH